MATFSWTHVIYVKNEHNRHIHYILHCTFTSHNLHHVFNTMFPMSYQEHTKKNPCFYTNYHTFLSPEILHNESVLLLVKYVNYLAKPNNFYNTFAPIHEKCYQNVSFSIKIIQLHIFTLCSYWNKTKTDTALPADI